MHLSHLFIFLIAIPFIIAQEGEGIGWLRFSNGSPQDLDVFISPVGDQADVNNTVVINAVGFSWQPSEITISVGTTVRWVFDDQEHNVAQVSNPESLERNMKEGFYSGPVGSEESSSPFEFTFESPGTFYYICEPHAPLGMRGSVRVTEEQEMEGQDFFVPVWNQVPFGEVTSYVPICPGTYFIGLQTALEFNTTTEPNDIALQFNLTVEAEMFLTLAFYGNLSQDIENEWTVFEDVTTAPNNDTALVRFINVSPGAPPLDLVLADTEEIVFANVSFENASEYMMVEPGSYNLSIRVSDEDGEELAPLFTVSNATFLEGQVFSLFAKGDLQVNPENFTVVPKLDSSLLLSRKSLDSLIGSC